VDSAFRGFAEGDDAGIEAVDECAEGQKVQRAFWGDVQTFAHDVVLMIEMFCHLTFPTEFQNDRKVQGASFLLF
jgi:hypothetical protein